MMTSFHRFKQFAAAGLRVGMFMSVVLAGRAATDRPNIVVILADDMGYSDIGSYGGEIPTPNMDQLAREGLRFTQFYNTSRCCPTRASLLTGLYQHQTGVGMMMSEGTARFDFGVDGYRGHLNRNCVTIAEVLRTAGYRTYMTGKWHLGGEEADDRPVQRGFDRFYGSLSGAFSFFKPKEDRHLMLDNEALPPPDPKTYYTTDAFTEKAIEFIESDKDRSPFFLYLAHNAPHWPLHAKPEDIAKFQGKYRAGWDELRAARGKRQAESGLFPASLGISPRDEKVRPWQELSEQEKADADYRMAVYAAQVYSMDENIGKLVAYLKKTGRYENTIIAVMSDNGACAEPYSELGGGKQEEINNPETWGMISYGRGWANLSNTPFREYKNRPTEGGIASPLIITWPRGLSPKLAGSFHRGLAHITDFMPTFVDVSGARYPAVTKGELVHPMVGRSLLPVLRSGEREPAEYLFFEHSNNCAVRSGKWKATARYGEFKWQLYDLEADRLEDRDVAKENPEVVKRLEEAWLRWALQAKVAPKGTPPPGSYN
jgi:arylsulfatase A-like enzyme